MHNVITLIKHFLVKTTALIIIKLIQKNFDTNKIENVVT